MKKILIGALALALMQSDGYAIGVDFTQTVNVCVDEPQFPFPDIPITLQTVEARKDYLLRHYWDNFDFADRGLVDNPRISEQGLVNFIALLAEESSKELKEAAFRQYVYRMTLQPYARRHFMKMTSDYLYDVTSPMYNESLYTYYLSALLESPQLGEAERQRAHFFLNLLNRNNPGQFATDFSFFTSDNRHHSLLKTAVGGDFLLLLFYDPECEQCNETLQEMLADTWFSSLVSSGKVSVLAVYTEGDESAWRTGMGKMSPQWLVGNDHGRIKEKSLYDLKAMPSLYLLDKEKRVVLKDASFRKIKNFLMRQ